MEKKYKIHEVAEYLGLTATAIRHYEQKGLIQIEKDPENGYRMFSEEDIYKIWSVAYHRSIDMSIETIDFLKHSHSLEDVRVSVAEHRERNRLLKEEAERNIRRCDFYERYLRLASRKDNPPVVKDGITLYFYPREEIYRREGDSFPGCTLGSIYNESGEQKYSLVYGDDMELLTEDARNKYLYKAELGKMLSIVIGSKHFFHTESLPQMAKAIAEEAGYDVKFPFYSVYLVSSDYFSQPLRYYEILMTL